jgi:hypothetical protein
LPSIEQVTLQRVEGLACRCGGKLPEAARGVLETVYGATEGFDTHDLKFGRRLLASMR